MAGTVEMCYRQGGFQLSHKRLCSHIVIFMEHVCKLQQLLTPKDISLPKSVHVNQNGNVSIVFRLLEVKSVSQVHF